MQRYLVVAAVLVLVFLICYVSGVSLAQEEEEIEYTWGTVSSLTSNQIVVTEYDYDTGEDVDVTCAVDSGAELKNVDSLNNIAVGDSVEIEYVVRDGKKVVKVISLEKPSYEEESTPSEAYEERTEYSPEEVEY